MCCREVEKDKAKLSERMRREDPVPGTMEEPLRGTVRHIQSVVSRSARRSVYAFNRSCFNCVPQIEPDCSVKEFLSQTGLTPLHSPPSFSSECGGSCSGSCSNAVLASHKGHESRHIVVGLHTCGDLGATLMRVFRENEQIVGLVSVGCCYMKLSCNGDESSGTTCAYPMSEFVSSLLPGSSLSYEAREVACHSIEVYSQRLEGKDCVCV